METKKATSAGLKRKRKMKAKTTSSEPECIKVNTVPTTEPVNEVFHEPSGISKQEEQELVEKMGDKYPILKDINLINKFLNVDITNNQKGRIRQAIKESLKGSSNVLVPDIINGKIHDMLCEELTPSKLRRIRILYNLLRTSLFNQVIVPKKTKSDKPNKKKKADANGNTKDEMKKEVNKENNKVKGPKRYVAFLGNLPTNVDTEMVMKHFSEMDEHIKSVRIPKPAEGRKSCFAFLELSNEASFEFALSKHHSMMGTRRINVLYTAQKNGKVSKGEAKSKTAKLIALQKSGQLVGSTPLAKKRSQRRKKQKAAQAKQAENA